MFNIMYSCPQIHIKVCKGLNILVHILGSRCLVKKKPKHRNAALRNFVCCIRFLKNLNYISVTFMFYLERLSF